MADKALHHAFEEVCARVMAQFLQHGLQACVFEVDPKRIGAFGDAVGEQQ